jgi:hypothetical protein
MEKRYGIRSSTIAIYTSNGQRVMVSVPVNAIITSSEDILDGDRLIDVVWDGKHYWMFSQDLRDRGEPLD